MASTSAPVPQSTSLQSTSLRFADARWTYIVTAVMLAAVEVALLWVPSYAKATPALGGFPFFYWYTLLWLLINAVMQFGAYQLLVARPRRRRARGARTGVAL